MRTRLIYLAIFLGLSAAVTAQDMTPKSIDIVEVASASGQFDTLLNAILQAGLAEDLANAEEITILAPINEAFVGVENLEALLNDKEALASTLKLHVLPSVYLAEDIPEGSTEVETLAGQSITIVNEDGLIRILLPSGGEAMVVRADIQSENGVIHAINKVLSVNE